MQYNNNTHIIFTKNLVELVDIFHKKIALLLIVINLSQNILIK